eukprot:6194172-Pleurochrysis_carterae.AAC.2
MQRSSPAWGRSELGLQRQLRIPCKSRSESPSEMQAELGKAWSTRTDKEAITECERERQAAYGRDVRYKPKKMIKRMEGKREEGWQGLQNTKRSNKGKAGRNGRRKQEGMKWAQQLRATEDREERARTEDCEEEEREEASSTGAATCRKLRGGKQRNLEAQEQQRGSEETREGQWQQERGVLKERASRRKDGKPETGQGAWAQSSKSRNGRSKNWVARYRRTVCAKM